MELELCSGVPEEACGECVRVPQNKEKSQVDYAPHKPVVYHFTQSSSSALPQLILTQPWELHRWRQAPPT